MLFGITCNLLVTPMHTGINYKNSKKSEEDRGFGTTKKYVLLNCSELICNSTVCWNYNYKSLQLAWQEQWGKASELRCKFLGSIPNDINWNAALL